MSSHFKSHETNDYTTSQTPACAMYSAWLDIPSRTVHPQARMPCMDHVTYRNEKELRELNESLHNLQMSEVDLYLQNRIGRKALDAMERIDPSHR
ncbi:hypothetical protein QZH41_018102 [Actinostola sp. cb2023]|nr:hypothetical protein QZH41_018102 [Actinostola sp. cb2023]